MTSQDYDNLINLLLASFFVFSLIGFSLAWYLRGLYESWYWLKYGVYCDDCAPLVVRPKEPVGYSYDCLNTSDCLCLKCFEALGQKVDK